MKVQVIRAGNRVQRFHTKEVLRKETVGHHCANVAGLLVEIYHRAHRTLPPPVLLTHALFHDSAEQHTGDVPAPAKWGNIDLREALHSAELRFCSDSGIPILWMRLSPSEQQVFRFADAFDCWVFFMEEKRLGNRMVDWIPAKRQMILALEALPPSYSNVAYELIEEVESYVCK